MALAAYPRAIVLVRVAQRAVVDGVAGIVGATAVIMNAPLDYMDYTARYVQNAAPEHTLHHAAMAVAYHVVLVCAH